MVGGVCLAGQATNEAFRTGSETYEMLDQKVKLPRKAASRIAHLRTTCCDTRK
jgi:hypothetical protein